MLRKSTRKGGFTLYELVLVVTVLVVLAAIIKPALTMARGSAHSTFCKSRLGDWGKAYQDYLFDNDEKFHNGDSLSSRSCEDMWMMSLKKYIDDDNEMMFCPSATETADAGGQFPNRAWELKLDKYYLPVHKAKFAQGSYCLNWWVNNAGGDNYSSYYWRTAQVNDAENIPVLADGGDYSASVYDDGKHYRPCSTAIDENMSSDLFDCHANINRFLMQRHGNSVNTLFMDWSVRDVPLFDLWSLNWHKGYEPISKDNANWQWPEWMNE